MRPDRAWVRLSPSGRPLNPDPGTSEDADLAVGLSGTYRWGGHSAWELPLFKPHLGAGYAGLVERLQRMIVARYQLPAWAEQDFARRKRADRLAPANDALHVVGWSHHDIRHKLEIAVVPLTHDPLPAPRGMRLWQPWPPQLAAKLFLRELDRLTVDMNLPDAPAPTVQGDAAYV